MTFANAKIILLNIVNDALLAKNVFGPIEK